MFRRLITLPLLFACSAPALAAETYETMLDAGDGKGASVSYNASCGEECYAATLGCDGEGGVGFTFADVEAKIAAAAITKKSQDFSVTVGSKVHSFLIINLKYGGEMYGTWDVDGELRGSDAEAFVAALAKAKNYAVKLGAKTLTLPVNADVLAWAKACQK